MSITETESGLLLTCAEDRCLLITGHISIMLMIVCIPYPGIHLRVGQRLAGERMIRPAGERKSTVRILMEFIHGKFGRLPGL